MTKKTPKRKLGFSDDYLDSKELIETLKEEVETAMTLAISCCRKLTTVLEMIETEEDLTTFKRRTEKKVRDVLKVAKKGVALKKVESYQVVDDS